VISSLGGRCPKKLRSLDGRFAIESAEGLRVPDVGEGGSRAFSGSRTPRPLKMLIELARLVFLLVGGPSALFCENDESSASYDLTFAILRTVKPCSRVG
jgi:hypothetical protein